MTIIAIYKYRTLWTEDTTRRLLASLKVLMPGAFPLMLPTSIDESIAIDDTSNDGWSVIPKSLLIDPVFLSFHGADGSRIEVAQTTKVGLRPGSVIITFAGAQDSHVTWGIVNSAREIGGELGIAGDRTLLTRMYSRGLEVDGSLVPLAVGDVNFWCDEWVTRFSDEQLSALEARSSRFEQSAAGLSFKIEEGTVMQPGANLLKIEELIDLKGIHGRYRKNERKRGI